MKHIGDLFAVMQYWRISYESYGVCAHNYKFLIQSHDWFISRLLVESRSGFEKIRIDRSVGKDEF